MPESNDTVVILLESLKKKESEYSQKIARLQGQHDQLLEQLKSQFGLDNLEDAKERLSKLGEEIRRRQADLVQKLDNLRKMTKDL